MFVITQMSLWLMLIASVAMRFYAPVGLNNLFLLTVSVMALFAYFISAIHLSKEYDRFSWVGLFNFFSLGYLIVHIHNPLLSCFVEEIKYYNKNWFSVDHVCSSAALSLAGYLAFLIVYTFFKSRDRGILTDKPTTTLSLTILKWVVLVLAIASYVAFFVFLGLAGEKYRSGIYSGGGDYWGSGATYAFLVFQIFLFSAIILDLYRLRILYERLTSIQFIMRQNPLVLGIAGLFILVSIYVGDRGPVMQIIMLYAAAYGIYFGKIRLLKFTLFVLIGAIAMSYLARYRTSFEGVSFEDKIEEGKYQMSQTKWYQPTAELGTSFRCVPASELIVENNGLFWGFFKINNFASCIPFASRFLAPNLGMGMSGVTSSRYLTSVMIGPTSTIGVGTTVVADIYLDFGFPGVLILMGFIGWFFARLENRSVTCYSLMYFSAYLLFVSIAFYWSRAHFFPHSKLILWGLIFIRILHVLTSSNLKLTRLQILQRYRSRP